MYTEITHELVTHLSLTGNSLKVKTYAERLVERFVEDVLFLAEVFTFQCFTHSNIPSPILLVIRA